MKFSLPVSPVKPEPILGLQSRRARRLSRSDSDAEEAARRHDVINLIDNAY